MIFSENKEEKKTSATVINGNVTEKYDCSFLACENPVCTCGTMTIKFSPIQNKNHPDIVLAPFTLEINAVDRKLERKNKEKSPESIDYYELVFSQLEEADFQLLFKRYFEHKNRATENANIESIDAYFDYDEVEINGLMSAYNDVLPYGDQIHVTINGENYIVLDQYCLLPKCSCSNVTLTLMTMDVTGQTRDELCSVQLKYKKKKWRSLEKQSLNISLNALRANIEEQVPGFYKKLLQRHLKLKGIYAHCKKRHFTSTNSLELPKVGRNDPCPCGSGKKYKKCCMRKSN